MNCYWWNEDQKTCILNQKCIDTCKDFEILSDYLNELLKNEK